MGGVILIVVLLLYVFGLLGYWIGKPAGKGGMGALLGCLLGPLGLIVIAIVALGPPVQRDTRGPHWIAPISVWLASPASRRKAKPPR